MLLIKGMSYLHGKKIIHKDLRSKNIFLENNKVVITDFGLFSMRRLCKQSDPARYNVRILLVCESAFER